MFTINDRAANYGDGIFTTMLVENGAVALFERHLSRLISDSSKLRLELNESVLRATMTNEIQSNRNGVLKLLVSSGEGGRGYLRNTHNKPGFHFSWHRIPEIYSNWQHHGIRIGVSEVHLASQPLLAGSKHLNRLEQVLIKQSLAESDLDDVIVCDYTGNVIEMSAANLFWRVDDNWFTPSVEQAGVAGVMRSFMLDYFSRQGNNAIICASPVSVLTNATAVFMCNALMKLVPIKSLRLKSAVKEYDCAEVIQLQHAIESEFKDEYVSFG
ncbi:aminodeoxychorismate lyase [Alteromonas ponticola]|uniref:Aminodeoxychorismate lyase n=1 Tax=Alteromonas ponticola TaxID=2720613 RepID=A0ABX1QYU5_9ALTE|nr:aminodeoxychorismate lyase [Alteromonas ponticola]NMH58673.1 aminodeoxychorismate lyase [Alteromonas ponticola]